ncbi:MAG: hypothetical protein BGO77_04835 [Caedibacter sp. 37-49]|nr:MAG: hypothetical protein BGO77_04835 [Caedibacter sp. 37-49]
MLAKLLLLLFASLGFDSSSQTPVLKNGSQERLAVHLISKRNTDNLKELKRHFSKKNEPKPLFKLYNFKYRKIKFALPSQTHSKPLKNSSLRFSFIGISFKISQKVRIFDSKNKMYILLDVKPFIETQKIHTIYTIENYDRNHDDHTLFTSSYSQLDGSFAVDSEIVSIQPNRLNSSLLDKNACSSSETLMFNKKETFVFHDAQEKVVSSTFSPSIKNKSTIQILEVATATLAPHPQSTSLFEDKASTSQIPTFIPTSTNMSVIATTPAPIARSSTQTESVVLPFSLIPTVTPTFPFITTNNLINTPSPLVGESITDTQVLATIPPSITENTKETSLHDCTKIVSPISIRPLTPKTNRLNTLITYMSTNNPMAPESLPIIQPSTPSSSNKETSTQASPSRPTLKRKVTPPLSHFQLSFKAAEHYFNERQAKLVPKEILPDVKNHDNKPNTRPDLLRDTLNKPDEILQKNYFEKILNSNMRVEYIYDLQNKLPSHATVAQDFSRKLKEHSSLLDDYMLTQDEEIFEQELLKDPDYSNSYHLIENVRAHHRRSKMSTEPE